LEAKDSLFYQKKTLNLKGKAIALDAPAVMGILNVTPDSFYSESRHKNEDEIVRSVDKMLAQGANFIDVGGYSTRPGAINITEDEELKRVIPAIELILKKYPEANLSVDTFKGRIAELAVGSGAVIVNDISGGTLDPKMFDTIAKLNVPYILTHMKGTPQDMKEKAVYEDLISEMMDFFSERLSHLRGLGVKDIILDPGLGFAKKIFHNFEILKNLDFFHALNLPILIGVSRKSMIYRSLNVSVEKALNGTTILNTIGLMKGASILRVHDVKEAVEAVKLFKLIYK